MAENTSREREWDASEQEALRILERAAVMAGVIAPTGTYDRAVVRLAVILAAHYCETRPRNLNVKIRIILACQ